jgi:hypothetical protein
MKLKTTTQLFPNLSSEDFRVPNIFIGNSKIGKFKFFYCILLIFLTYNLSAQSASTYTFSSSSGATFTTLTGSTQLIAAGSDDGVSSVTSIGFTFAFEQTNYTQFSVSANGFLKLGSVVTVAEPTNSVANSTVKPKLAICWDDLSTGANGKVHYLLTGSSPNRILKVEFRNYFSYGTASNYNMNSQIWLYETTNVIEYYYGTGTLSSNSASIGIIGATTGNYFARNHLTNNTCASSGGLNSITTWPTSGTKYTFTPPVSCTAPATQATIFSNSNVAEQSMTLGWTRGNGNNVMIVAKAGSAPTDPTSGTSYTANAAYASGTACGGGYVVYSGTGTSVNLTGLTGGTTYYFAAYEYNTTGTCYNTTELVGSYATLNQETWIGVTSIDWNIGSNWSSGYVPTSATNVTIPSGTPFAPTISASANAVCKNLTINSSATLTENAPSIYYFAIYGNIICNGTFISANFVELNGGLVSDFATISGTGDLSDLSVDLGYDNNIGFYKLLNDITLGEFYLDSYWGNSIFDMNGYNFTVDFFSLESSTTFYQKTGILSIEDPAATIDDISFVEATGTTYFSRGTIWVASSNQTIPSITYYNLKVRANNGVTATIGSGTAFSVAGDLTVLNPSTAGGVVSLVENVTVSGNTLIGTSGNALTLNLSKRIIGTGTFTMGNLAAHAINISFAHATNFAITCSGSPTFYGTVTYTSASAQKVITATSYNNLTFDLAGTKTLFGNLDVNGNLTLTAGTLDVSSSNYSINLAGDFVRATASIFTPQSGTVTFDGTSTQVVHVTSSGGSTACNSDVTFYNVIIDGTSVKMYYNKTNDRKININDLTVNSGKILEFISQ